MDAKHDVDSKHIERGDKNEEKTTDTNDEELLWLCNTLEEYKEQNDAYVSELAELRDKLMRYDEVEKKRKSGKSTIETRKNDNLLLIHDLEEAVVMLDSTLVQTQDLLNQKEVELQELKEELMRSMKLNENLSLKIHERDEYIEKVTSNCKSLKSRNKDLQQTLEQYEDDINNKRSQLIELKQHKTAFSPHRSPKNSKKSPLKATWQQTASPSTSTSIIVENSEKAAFFGAEGSQSTNNWADGGDKYTNLFARINIRKNENERNQDDHIFLDDNFDDLVLHDSRSNVEEDTTVVTIRKSRPPQPKSNIPPTLLSRVRDITAKPFVSQVAKDRSDVSDRSSPYESGSDTSATSVVTARSGLSDTNNKKFARTKGMSQPLYSTTQLNAEAILNNNNI